MKSLLLAVCLLSASAVALANTSCGNHKSGSEALQAYTNILNSCNGGDIDSCLDKFKALPSEQKSTQNQVKAGYSCCLNVSNTWGEFAYIHGQSYCIPPC